jgi:hypothetical protein
MGRKPKPVTATIPVESLLVSRQHASVILGDVDPTTLYRLEAEKILFPIRLNPRSEKSPVFYRKGNVLALAEGRIDAWLQENAPQQLKKPKQRKRLSKGGGSCAGSIPRK